MNCPLCGEVCRCPLEPLPAASSQWRPDCEPASGSSSVAALESKPDVAEAVAGAGSDLHSHGESATSHAPAEVEPEGGDAWRGELSARLNRYRARRKVRPPRYPSLSLRFEAAEVPASTSAQNAFSPPDFEPVSDHALALDGMRRGPSGENEGQFQQAPAAETAPQQVRAAGHSTAKIIEFPRFAWGPPPPPSDQLAEPVSERPRILEVPEVAPPLPALGGISIEAVERPAAEKRPGIDIPLQSAPLGRRFLATLVDGTIVAAASALFGFIFWKVAAVRPPLVQILGLGAAIPCLFWWAYQYLLIVYAASTPGLRVAGLQLARFDGTSTTRSLRRWRVLAACLSGLSLGMGYAWVFLDEDALCWHDRITHTYLAPREVPAQVRRTPEDVTRRPTASPANGFEH
jgi:uncharacterized RDD family membrane protein YckC